jgi:hypothetical protein
MHFAADGQPDSWSSKDKFLNFYLATGAFFMILFMGIAFGMKYIPASLINFPNKNYWLSPERRQNSLDFFSGYFLWFASATILLLFDIMNQSIRVHIGEVGKLPHPMMSLGLYLGFTVVWCAGIIFKFVKSSRPGA